MKNFNQLIQNNIFYQNEDDKLVFSRYENQKLFHNAIKDCIYKRKKTYIALENEGLLMKVKPLEKTLGSSSLVLVEIKFPNL